MSTDGWVDQAVFAFTDLLWCVILFLFNIFYSLDYRYTGNAVVLEYKRWKTAIVCSPSVSPKVLWWYSRQTNISCLWSGKNLTNRLVKIKKGFQFLPNLLTVSREGHGYDGVKKNPGNKASSLISVPPPPCRNSSQDVRFLFWECVFSFFAIPPSFICLFIMWNRWKGRGEIACVLCK